MKTTPWFPFSIFPVREGVYEVQMAVLEDRFGTYAIETGFCYFGFAGGVGWSRVESTPEDAHKRQLLRGSQRKVWRGLTKASKGNGND